MRKNTSKRDGCADQRIQLFVTTDGELQMARRNTLHFEVFGGIASKLEDFGGEVFKDGSDVDGG